MSKELCFLDKNGENVHIGDSIIWHDPDTCVPWYENDRMYKVVGIPDPDSRIEIQDDWSYAEVDPDECEKITLVTNDSKEFLYRIGSLRQDIENLRVSASNIRNYRCDFLDEYLGDKLCCMVEWFATQVEQALSDARH